MTTHPPRYARTNGQWDVLRPLLRPGTPGGRPPADPRRLLDAMLWVLHTGAPWRDVPDRLGPWQTAYHRFNADRRDGTGDRVVETLPRAAALDHAPWDIDGTVVRAARPPGRKKSGPG